MGRGAGAGGDNEDHGAAPPAPPAARANGNVGTLSNFERARALAERKAKQQEAEAKDQPAPRKAAKRQGNRVPPKEAVGKGNTVAWKEEEELKPSEPAQRSVQPVGNFERARALAERKAKQQEAAAKDQPAPRKAAKRQGNRVPPKEAVGKGNTVAWKEEEERKPSEPEQLADHVRSFGDAEARAVKEERDEAIGSRGRVSFRDAEERVLGKLRGTPAPIVVDDGGTLPGAVPAEEHHHSAPPAENPKTNRQRAVSISTTVYDGIGIIDHDAERDNIEKELSAKSSYTFHGVHCCIISPMGRFRMAWNVLITVLLLYVALAVPYRVGFAVSLAPLGFSWWVDLVAEMIFIVDIVLNFCTGIPHDYGYVEMRPDRIRRTYLRGWFAVDLLACVPLRLLSMMLVDYDGDESERAKILKVLRLLRITRLLQLGKIRYMFMSHVDWAAQLLKLARYGKLSAVFVGLTYSCHVFGCIWFFFGTLDNDGPVANPDSWIVARGIHNSTLQIKYITSFYWAVTALSTVGFGDIAATTRFEMLFSSFTVMVGTVFFAVMITHLGKVMVDKGVLSDKTTRQLDELSQYMIQKQLPKPLRNRVRMFLEITYRDEAFDSQAMLDRLPWELQDQVRRQIFKSELEEMPLFDGIRWSKPTGQDDLAHEEYLINLLCKEFKKVNVLTGQTIYHEGELGGEFYCITRGSVILTSAFGYKRVIGQGDFFGERELFFSRRFEDSGADADDYSAQPALASSPMNRSRRVTGFSGVIAGVQGQQKTINGLPIQGRRRHQTATCTVDAELKFMKWPQLLMLRQGGVVGIAVYNRIAEAARARGAEDSEIAQRRSKRKVIQEWHDVMKSMHAHDDLDVLATNIQAAWRGKVVRRKISRRRSRNEASLDRVVTLLERLESRVVRLERHMGTLPPGNTTAERRAKPKAPT